jgi:hypothetical protein
MSAAAGRSIVCKIKGIFKIPSPGKIFQKEKAQAMK